MSERRPRIIHVCECRRDIDPMYDSTGCTCGLCGGTIKAYNLDRLLRIEEKARKHKSEFEEGGSLRGALAALDELWAALAEPGERKD